MNIFVINLEKDVERRVSITGQLNALGLAHEIVSGIYGAALSAKERAQHYADRKAKWRQARSLTPAEIGCALSHLKVYREMIARGIDSALILEDDVSLPSDLGTLLDECATALDVCKPEVWLLSPAQGDPTSGQPRPIGPRHRLMPYTDGFYTSSYLLTLPAARALLAELYPVGDVADCWLRLHRYRVVDLFVVTPPVIEQNQEVFGSSTTADYHRSGKRNLLRASLYKLRRARSIIRDFFYASYRRWAAHR